jgi:hypothetical protein
MYIAVHITNQTKTRNGTRTEIVWDSYIASTPGECRDSVDREVFELVQQFGSCITIGQTVGNPATIRYRRTS